MGSAGQSRRLNVRNSRFNSYPSGWTALRLSAGGHGYRSDRRKQGFGLRIKSYGICMTPQVAVVTALLHWFDNAPPATADMRSSGSGVTRRNPLTVVCCHRTANALRPAPLRHCMSPDPPDP